MLLLFFLRMPIGFTMLFVGVIGLSYLITPTAGLSMLGSFLIHQWSEYSFTAFPMFILAGSIAFAAGIGGRLFDGFYTMLRRVPGSLVIASIAGCAGFSAICGSSTATAATMSKVALPEMKKYGYDVSLATGAIAAAGSLGPLIPPSVVFILYGILTNQSIGKLFVAGIIPGIMNAGLFALVVILLCLRNPALAPIGPPLSRNQKIEGVIGLLETLILFGVTIGGLFLGWFTPTQGGAALAAAVIILCLARRQLSLQGFVESVKDTIRITCMLMIVMAGGVVFARFIAITDIPTILVDWLSTAQFSPTVIMIIILLMYVITGFFMDSLGVLLLTLPILYPIVIALGYDPLWFGVMIVVTAETAVISPPLALNIYVIHSVAKDVPIETIIKGIWPFLGILCVSIILLLAFPQIVTFLPGIITY
jgi:C4-dicarboxylate transporter DctM subunit